MGHSSINSFLLIRPDALGDVTLMVPLINTIRATYPAATIRTLQQSYTADLLTNHPAVDEVLIDRYKTGEYRGIRGFFAYVRWIKSLEIDCVIHSYFEPYYAAVAWCAGIKYRVGDAQKLGLRWSINRATPLIYRNVCLHEVEQNIRLLGALDTPVIPSLTMNLCVESQAKESVVKQLKDKGWTDAETLICVHPTTGGGNRAWLPQKYGELTRLLVQNKPCRVVLTGFGAQDQACVDQIRSIAPDKTIDCCGSTTLHELKALISLCSVVIGTDTGPTHIAAALDIPVVSISPTKFVKSSRWGPWMTPHDIVSQSQGCELICNPYQCQESICLDAIDIQQVLNSVNDLLAGKPTPSVRNQKVAWLQASIVIMKIIDTDDDIQSLIEFKQRYPRSQVMAAIISSSVSKTALQALDLHRIICIKSSWWNVLGWFRQISRHDVGIIQHQNQRMVTWWKMIAMLTSLSQYIPPIVVSESGAAGQEWDHYCQCFDQVK